MCVCVCVCVCVREREREREREIMADCTDPAGDVPDSIYDKQRNFGVEKSWTKTDTKVANCVGKFDVTSFQLEG